MTDPFYIEIHRAKEVMKVLKEMHDATIECAALHDKLAQLVEFLEASTIKGGSNGT